VTAHASCGVQTVVVIDVAIRTGSRRDRVQACEREPSTVVVKSRIQPVGSVVALVASLWEVCGDVVRIGGALIVLEVAAHARRTVQRVIVVDVAIRTGARRNRVHSGQSETSCRVIEFSVGPLHRVVALLASSRESRMGYR